MVVARVLVQRLADRRGGGDEPDRAAVGREDLGGVEPDRAAAPVRHHDLAAVRRALGGEHVPGLHGAHAAGVERRFVRPRARRDHDRVGCVGAQLLEAGLGPQPELDPRVLGEPGVVLAQPRGELAVRGRGAGEGDLAADHPAALEDDDAVPGGRRLGGGREAGRPGADHRHAVRPRRLADRGSVRSRPVRGFCPQAIGVPAW